MCVCRGEQQLAALGQRQREGHGEGPCRELRSEQAASPRGDLSGRRALRPRGHVPELRGRRLSALPASPAALPFVPGCLCPQRLHLPSLRRPWAAAPRVYEEGSERKHAERAIRRPRPENTHLWHHSRSSLVLSRLPR